jgi:hypothetical protein
VQSRCGDGSMREIIFFVSRWATNFALACLAIAASVGPEDAMSNLSRWATRLHLPDPTWLQSHTADKIVFWIAIFGVITILIGPMTWRKRHRLVNSMSRKWVKQVEPAQSEAADDPEIMEALDTIIRESLKKFEIPVEEAIRPSIRLKFLRWRGFYEFFARRPFFFYWAKRRLEFIDSWAWFFREHNKVIIHDLSNERSKHKARIAIALIYLTNRTPAEIYHLGLRPEDLRTEVELKISDLLPQQGLRKAG